jgi:hypothetical protein
MRVSGSLVAREQYVSGPRACLGHSVSPELTKYQKFCTARLESKYLQQTYRNRFHVCIKILSASSIQ